MAALLMPVMMYFCSTRNSSTMGIMAHHRADMIFIVVGNLLPGEGVFQLLHAPTAMVRLASVLVTILGQK